MTLDTPTTEPIDTAETRILGRQIEAGTAPQFIRQTIKEATGNSNREASNAVRRAEALHDLPKVVEQLESGDLSTGQVDLIVKAVNDTSAQTVADDPGLIDRIKEATVNKGYRLVKDWALKINSDEDLAKRHTRQHAKREIGFYQDDAVRFAH